MSMATFSMQVTWDDLTLRFNCRRDTTVGEVRKWIPRVFINWRSDWEDQPLHLFATRDLGTQAQQPLSDQARCGEYITNGIIAYPPSMLADLLRRRLSHTSHAILSSVQQIPPSQLDFHSVREVAISPEEAVASAELLSQLRILVEGRDGSVTSTRLVTHDGEELVPYRLLPDGGGVEMRGRFICEYRAASDEYLEELAQVTADRESAIAHSNRLLADLPVALSNSRAAMHLLLTAAVNGSTDAELSEISVMAVEQLRIGQEVDTQKNKLLALESEPPPVLDQVRFLLRRLQTSVALPFGASRLGEQVIHLHLIKSTPQTVTAVALGLQ